MTTAPGLIFFDLDRTLIDDAYRLFPATAEDLQERIQTAVASGWRVGLNSDTPEVPLYRWYTLFGMNGPIIAEGGAIVNLNPGRAPRQEVVITRTSEVKIARMRAELVAKLSAEPGCLVVLGDATNFIGAVAPAGATDRQLDVLDDMLVVINRYSRFSLRFFVRSIAQDASARRRLRVDIDATTSVREVVTDLIGNDNALTVPEHHSPAGITTVREADLAKAQGIAAALTSLRETTGRVPRRVVVVGDSESDYVAERYRATGVEFQHFAVGNADADFKRRTDVHRLRGNFTSGCIEALDCLLEAQGS